MNLLRCPQCGTGFERPTAEPEITCVQGHSFPVVNGIPRFQVAASVTPAKALASFNFQYGRYPWIYDYDRRRARWIFSEIFGIDRSDIVGKAVCVVGCGNGCEVAAMTDHDPAAVVGFDLTDSIEDAARNIGDAANVQVAQADALSPPVAAGGFDVVYSDGVMPHASDPVGFLRSAHSLVAPEGVLFLRTLVDHPGDARWTQLPRRMIRAVSSRLPSLLWWHLCFVIACLIKVPGLGKLLTRGMFYIDRETDSSIRSIQLMNFRRFGDHAFRHRMSAEQIRDVLTATTPDGTISINGPVVVVDRRPSASAS